MTRLYLDDLRTPTTDYRWHVVRSYDEAVAWVEKNGMPDYVSFDHDLGEDSKTGYDFAKWLIDQDEQGRHRFRYGFHYNVHSANPVGVKNITELFAGYQSYRDRQGSTIEEMKWTDS
jgi:hypothetical protein